MPLPAPRSPWPPPELQPALQRMGEWEAWWSADADALGAHYGSRPGGPDIRPSQYAGGVVGKLARMWWGRPPAKHEPDTKLHVPLPADICRTSANMLFSEPIAASSAHAETSARLDTLLDEGVQAKLLEGAELQAALGGVYWRPVYDPTLSDRAWLDAVGPDAAIPEWRWGRLAAVTFWRTVREEDGLVWRHFERHEPRWIVHALYQGTGSEVGRPVPLDDSPATRGFSPLVNEAGAIETQYPYLTASYVPNMRPNPKWRRKPLLAPMGRPDLDGNEGTFDAIDETYASLMRDVRLGKGRIVVGDSMLDDQGPGRGATFDPDREAYTVVAGALAKDVPLTVAQFDIRVEEHFRIMRELTNIALRRAGYANITLGEVEGGQAITATEVKAKGQLSWVTRDRKVGYWRPGLEREMLPALLVVDAVAFRRPLPDLSEPISVGFADAVAEDLGTLAGTVDVLNRAQAASIETRVRIVHPDWDDTQVLDEVRKIREDGGAGAAVPFDYGDGGEPTETDDMRAAAGQDDEQPDDPQETA